jgi:hypothetical protein
MLPYGWAATGRTEVHDVLGRLPLRYRMTIWIAGLVSCAGVGAWIGSIATLPLVWSSGAVIGATIGVVVVAAYVAALERGPSTSRPADPSS